MNQQEKGQAILFIRPAAQFVLRGLDVEWMDEAQTQPSQEEIEAGWVAYQAAQKVEAEARATAKAAAEAKLEALGLTTDDLKALGL
jgi:3-oxoacyl-[acyl-carrier-protein] synthase III